MKSSTQTVTFSAWALVFGVALFAQGFVMPARAMEIAMASSKASAKSAARLYNSAAGLGFHDPSQSSNPSLQIMAELGDHTGHNAAFTLTNLNQHPALNGLLGLMSPLFRYRISGTGFPQFDPTKESGLDLRARSTDAPTSETLGTPDLTSSALRETAADEAFNPRSIGPLPWSTLAGGSTSSAIGNPHDGSNSSHAGASRFPGIGGAGGSTAPTSSDGATTDGSDDGEPSEVVFGIGNGGTDTLAPSDAISGQQSFENFDLAVEGQHVPDGSPHGWIAIVALLVVAEAKRRQVRMRNMNGPNGFYLETLKKKPLIYANRRS